MNKDDYKGSNQQRPGNRGGVWTRFARPFRFIRRTSHFALRTSSLQEDRGVALMVALLFILLLSAIVVEYCYETQVDASLAGNARDDLQASIAAKSAIASGLGLLHADLLVDNAGGPVGTAKGGVSGTSAQQQQQQQMATVQYDSLQDVWAQGVPGQMVNDAIAQCTITDEYGKINLNALMVNETDTNPQLENALRSLFQYLGVEEDPTDAILDWLDPDDEPRPNGAETSDYMGLETPYMCKNGPMDSIEELLLIKGITPELYFDCLANAQDQRNEMDDKQRIVLTLADFLTVHGHPYGAINVNTAPKEVLDAVFTGSDTGNPGTTDSIMQMRYESPFQSVQDFGSRAGVSTGTGAVQQQTGMTTGVRPQTPSGGTQTNTTSSARPSGPKALTPEKQAVGLPSLGGTSLTSNLTGQTTITGQKPTTQPLNQVLNGPQGGGQGHQLFEVRSDVFRIYGDGRAGNVMVRIEAYVYRNAAAINQTPQAGGQRASNSPQPTGSTTSGLIASKPTAGSQGQNGAPMEMFHIVDWRVIR